MSESWWVLCIGGAVAARLTVCRSTASGTRPLMVHEDTGPEAGAKGVAEGVKGKLKEAAGALAGDEALRSEGVAQQHKAGAEREVAKKEAEAEKARAEASAHEAEQRRLQR